MKVKLTSKIVSALALTGGKTDMTVWDSEVGGLGLRVRNRTGVVTKTWVVLKKQNKRCFKFSLGGIDIITLDAARKEAQTKLAKIALGQDPVAERRAAAAKDERKMSALVADYLKDKEREVRPRSLVEITRYLQGGSYFKPLHSVPVHEIDLSRVSKCVRDIERESGSATAREARSALSTFFSWCMQEGHCDRNPVIGSRTPTTKPRERVLTDAELAAIWKSCADDDDSGRIVKLLICTGCRRNEIGGLSWSWFAPDLSKFTIPAERCKNGRPHELPVMPMMRSIIERVPRVVDRDSLFGHRGDGFTLWDDRKKALDARCGVTGWTLHDIRRTVATGLGNLGIQPHVIEALLNHQSGSKRGVAGTYNRSPYANEVRNALATWHDRIRSLIDGGERVLVPFKQTTA
jgi:integrase